MDAFNELKNDEFDIEAFRLGDRVTVENNSFRDYSKDAGSFSSCSRLM